MGQRHCSPQATGATTQSWRHSYSMVPIPIFKLKCKGFALAHCSQLYSKAIRKSQSCSFFMGLNPKKRSCWAKKQLALSSINNISNFCTQSITYTSWHTAGRWSRQREWKACWPSARKTISTKFACMFDMNFLLFKLILTYNCYAIFE